MSQDLLTSKDVALFCVKCLIDTFLDHLVSFPRMKYHDCDEFSIKRDEGWQTMALVLLETTFLVTQERVCLNECVWC
jgi:hypothetical protein